MRYAQVTQATTRHFSTLRRLPRRLIQSCCDCGLVHEWRFVSINGYVWHKLRRHNAETKIERRRLKKKKRLTKV
jgi:hypothetical protein